MAEKKISELTPGTTPYNVGMLFEASVPDGIGGYLSRSARYSDMGFTLGTTTVGLGGTTGLVTALTLSGATLSGVTTLPGSGSITAAGELGLGVSPTALFSIGGTYTTTGANLVNLNGTFSSNNISNQQVIAHAPTITPTGSSLSILSSVNTNPIIDNTNINIGTFTGVASTITLGASYSGVINEARLFNAGNPTINGSGTITTLSGFFGGTNWTNGNNLASGTVTNNIFRAGVLNAGAAGGTVNNRGAFINVPTGGASSGTTNNRGIYITGNGGTAAGGTVNNFALFSDSTAPMQIGGTFQFLGATASFPMLKRSTTTIQVRLADDSGDGNLSVSQLTSTLATGTAPLVVASTTVVANLNASSLSGATFAAPGAIGETTPSTVKATYVKPSVGNALTASGTTRTDALQLANQINNVTTAPANTGVILPVGVVGMTIDIFNAGANPITVYASGSETIDTVTGSTGVPLANTKRCRYDFVAANTWISAQWGVISA